VSAIKVGDLVQVVRPAPCCGSTESIGKIFRVTGLASGDGCYYCQNSSKTYQLALGGWKHGTKIVRLKRIPPLSDLEGAVTQEKLRQPTKVKA